EVRLVVYELLLVELLREGLIADSNCLLTPPLKINIDFLIERLYLWKRLHAETCALIQSSSNGTRFCRSVAGETYHEGTSNVFARSTTKYNWLPIFKSTRPLAPMIHKPCGRSVALTSPS